MRRSTRPCCNPVRAVRGTRAVPLEGEDEGEDEDEREGEGEGEDEREGAAVVHTTTAV